MSDRVYSKVEIEHVASAAYHAGQGGRDGDRIIEDTLRKLDDPASRSFYGLPDPPSIHDLFEQVRQHPDFVFGTIFVREDFPGSDVPEDFPRRFAADLLAERGNLFIDDHLPEEAERE
jgi:hypothetical protein